MVDMHSHILFGVDDGARDLSESRRMLAAARAVGVDKIIATPHARSDSFDYQLVNERYCELREIAEEKGIVLRLGFEVHWNFLLSLDESEYLNFCLANTRQMLLEFSMSASELPQNHDQMIYRLQRSEINIIIAHPERYRFVQKDYSIIERWTDMGCRLQLDAICLLKSRGPKCKATARKLFDAEMYHYAASDAHCVEDYEAFGKACDWIDKQEK